MQALTLHGCAADDLFIYICLLFYRNGEKNGQNAGISADRGGQDESGEPSAKKVKLDVMVPEDYVSNFIFDHCYSKLTGFFLMLWDFLRNRLCCARKVLIAVSWVASKFTVNLDNGQCFQSYCSMRFTELVAGRG